MYKNICLGYSSHGDNLKFAVYAQKFSHKILQKLKKRIVKYIFLHRYSPKGKRESSLLKNLYRYKIMMLGSKDILPHDTYGLLRISCSRNPKNIRNPPYSGYFLMFCGSQSHVFSCKHDNHDLLTLVSNNVIILSKRYLHDKKNV